MNRLFQRQNRSLGDYAALGLVGLVFVAMLALIIAPEAILSAVPVALGTVQ